MDIQPTKLVFIKPPRYVLLPAAQAMTGYTIGAMKRKIQRGHWREHMEWRRAPDGRVVIDLDGFTRWIEGTNRRTRK